MTSVVLAKRTTQVRTLPLLTFSMIMRGSWEKFPLDPPFGPGPVSPPGFAIPAPPIPSRAVVAVIASMVWEVEKEGCCPSGAVLWGSPGWLGELGEEALGIAARVTGSVALPSLTPDEAWCLASIGCDGPEELVA